MSDLVLHSHLFQQSKHIQKFHKFLLFYLIPQSDLIPQSHILNSITNSIVWSRFTFSSYSTVSFIQKCCKFGCISSFTFISLSTVQTYSKVSQNHLFYLIPQFDLIPQSHILNCVTNSIVWSCFTFSSCSTVPFIQQFPNYLVFSNFTLISHS